MENLLFVRLEKKVRDGAKKIRHKIDESSSDDNDSDDMGSFNFKSNIKADYGISFKEGKHLD